MSSNIVAYSTKVHEYLVILEKESVDKLSSSWLVQLNRVSSNPVYFYQTPHPLPPTILVIQLDIDHIKFVDNRLMASGCFGAVSLGNQV